MVGLLESVPQDCSKYSFFWFLGDWIAWFGCARCIWIIQEETVKCMTPNCFWFMVCSQYFSRSFIKSLSSNSRNMIKNLKRTIDEAPGFKEVRVSPKKWKEFFNRHRKSTSEMEMEPEPVLGTSEPFQEAKELETSPKDKKKEETRSGTPSPLSLKEEKEFLKLAPTKINIIQKQNFFYSLNEAENDQFPLNRSCSLDERDSLKGRNSSGTAPVILNGTGPVQETRGKNQRSIDFRTRKRDQEKEPKLFFAGLKYKREYDYGDDAFIAKNRIEGAKMLQEHSEGGLGTEELLGKFKEMELGDYIGFLEKKLSETRRACSKGEKDLKERIERDIESEKIFLESMNHSESIMADVVTRLAPEEEYISHLKEIKEPLMSPFQFRKGNKTAENDRIAQRKRTFGLSPRKIGPIKQRNGKLGGRATEESDEDGPLIGKRSKKTREKEERFWRKTKGVATGHQFFLKKTGTLDSVAKGAKGNLDARNMIKLYESHWKLRLFPRGNYVCEPLCSDSDFFCQICSNEDFFEKDPLMVCSKCKVAVHSRCYGINSESNQKWTCQVCRSFGKNGALLRCPLCPNRGGAMKEAGNDCLNEVLKETFKELNPLYYEYIRSCTERKISGSLGQKTKSGSQPKSKMTSIGVEREESDSLDMKASEPICETPWIHISCLNWFHALYFLGQNIIGIENIPAPLFKSTCQICQKSHEGACIKCSGDSCELFFHAECARKSKFSMKTENSFETDSPGNIFCDFHAPSKIKKLVRKRQKIKEAEIMKLASAILKYSFNSLGLFRSFSKSLKNTQELNGTKPQKEKTTIESQDKREKEESIQQQEEPKMAKTMRKRAQIRVSGIEPKRENETQEAQKAMMEVEVTRESFREELVIEMKKRYSLRPTQKEKTIDEKETPPVAVVINNDIPVEYSLPLLENQRQPATKQHKRNDPVILIPLTKCDNSLENPEGMNSKEEALTPTNHQAKEDKRDQTKSKRRGSSTISGIKKLYRNELQTNSDLGTQVKFRVQDNDSEVSELLFPNTLLSTVPFTSFRKYVKGSQNIKRKLITCFKSIRAKTKRFLLEKKEKEMENQREELGNGQEEFKSEKGTMGSPENEMKSIRRKGRTRKMKEDPSRIEIETREEPSKRNGKSELSGLELRIDKENLNSQERGLNEKDGDSGRSQGASIIGRKAGGFSNKSKGEGLQIQIEKEPKVFRSKREISEEKQEKRNHFKWLRPFIEAKNEENPSSANVRSKPEGEIETKRPFQVKNIGNDFCVFLHRKKEQEAKEEKVQRNQMRISEFSNETRKETEISKATLWKPKLELSISLESKESHSEKKLQPIIPLKASNSRTQRKRANQQKASLKRQVFIGDEEETGRLGKLARKRGPKKAKKMQIASNSAGLGDDPLTFHFENDDLESLLKNYHSDEHKTNLSLSRELSCFPFQNNQGEAFGFSLNESQMSRCSLEEELSLLGPRTTRSNQSPSKKAPKDFYC